MTIQEILRETYSVYKLSPLDAEILLSLAIGKPREYILAHPEKKIAPPQIKKYFPFVQRRSAGEPIAYIVGKKEFFGLDFLVNKNVLIPRPETELLVEHALEKIPNANFDAVIDIGTGSGNIIITIAKNIPNKNQKKINFYALDISKKSLQIAEKNAKKYKLDKKIKFIQSDMMQYFLSSEIKFKNILIIANLPYVSSNIFRQNKKNLKFEPKTALLSQNNGLSHYIKLFEQTSLSFAVHCSLILEFSPEQRPEIGYIIKKYLPKAKTRFRKDLAGKWRMAMLSF
jgi:release factor glutamine methyltransferase